MERFRQDVRIREGDPSDLFKQYRVRSLKAYDDRIARYDPVDGKIKGELLLARILQVAEDGRTLQLHAGPCNTWTIKDLTTKNKDILCNLIHGCRKRKPESD
jgi:hypothetical protein